MIWLIFHTVTFDFYLVLTKQYCVPYTGAVEATFNGNSSVIQYSNTLLNTSQDTGIAFSLRLRTRDFNATLLYLRNTVLSSFISIQLSNGSLQIHYDFGTSSWVNTDMFVADGIWHEIRVTFSDNMTSLSVDGSSRSEQSLVNNQLPSFIDNSSEVFIGADAEQKNHFKGCLNEVRINSFLLPFFTRMELANDSSVERFDVVQMNDVKIGCHGDYVCGHSHCLNNGTCRDVWNAYVCDCAAGFNGTFCGNNIDECATGNQCMNGATCVDGIATYSCVCAAGFTGLLYVS